MRTFSAFLLVVLATILAPFVIATTWVTARVDDRQEYVDTVAPLAEDPAVRTVMADSASAAAVAALQQYVPVQLPAAVGDWAREAARTVVESPAFPDYWRETNADLHDDVIAILEDPDASRSGYLTVDGSRVVALVLAELAGRGIPIAVLPRIPLQVPVVERAKIVDAGPAYRAAHGPARALPLLWAGLVAAAVLLASGWRGRIRTLGLAALGGALGAVVVMVAVGPLTDAAVDKAQTRDQDLVRVMLDTVLSSLSPYARGFLVAVPVGIVLVAGSLWRSSREQEPDPRVSWDQ
jgi:hypothetical protein